MPMILKLCGFTRPDEASAAALLGATHIGVVLWAGSKRGVVDEVQAAEVFAAAKQGGAQPVAVLVNTSDPVAIALRIGAERVQLHGDEAPRVAAQLREAGLAVWRALRVGTQGIPNEVIDAWTAAGVDGFVLDALVAGVPGGTGARVDEEFAARFATGHPTVLAGGLKPGNVAAAIRAVRPDGVDVASGIETAPGLKDPRLMQQFLTAARAAFQEKR